MARNGGEVVIGIDLGTTYSCVAVFRNGMIEIIANDQGNRTTPSFVGFNPATDYERLIGEAAKNKAAVNPYHTIFDVKRLIGKKFDDREVQTDINYLPYSVVNRKGKPYVEVEIKDGQVKAFSAEEISAMVLGKMKETAESYLGKPVTGAVVTVPAYFNDAQRQATKQAGKIAGLNVLRIVNEPTAGALAYGLFGGGDRCGKRTILVYDLGGGTFDVSILEIENGSSFRVLATGGDAHLGGGDFDQRVIQYFLDLTKKKYKRDISGDRKAIGKLRRGCERAKRALSSQVQVHIDIDSLSPGIDFFEKLTRAKFEELNLDMFKKTLEIVQTTLEDAGLDKREIEEVVLVGGSTRIPRLREMLKEMFDGKEPSKGVNPDEAVAYGAAVLGASISGGGEGTLGIADVTLCDVTPLSLGDEVEGGLVDVIIPRNTPIPTKMSRSFVTLEDQQTSMSIKVYQGERPLTKDCVELGSFILTGLTPAPRGQTVVEDTFEIDADGILTVTAVEKNSPRTRGSLTITSCKGDLSQKKIEKMITEARRMAEEDKRAKERVVARNMLERYIYDVQDAIREGSYSSSVASRDGKRKMERELEQALEWLDENQHASKANYEDELNKLTDRYSLVVIR